MKKIAIAFREDTEDTFAVSVIEIIKRYGYEPYFLPQVKADFLQYENGKLLSCYKNGSDSMLKAQYAERVKNCSFDETNVEEVMQGVSSVVFTGGDDISPTLFHLSEEAKNNNEGFNAERDVSDYLLIKYCLEKDIKVFAICRGMQMMGVVRGLKVVQHLEDFYADKGVTYDFTHRDRYKKEYVLHDMTVNKESLLYRITGCEKLTEIPSWHHQAIIETGDNITESAFKITQGEKIVEGIEVKGKKFALGVQFHLEEILYNKSKFDYPEKTVRTAEKFFEKVLSVLTEE